MNRLTSITLMAVLVLALIAVPLGAAVGFSPAGAQDESESDGGNDSIEPGEQFSASVGVQNAEIDGAVSEGALGIAIANAETNGTKAAVIGEFHQKLESRLDALETRLEALNESREADEIGEGRYRGEVASIVAETRSIERRAAIVETAAAGLPESVLAEHEVDVDSIRALRERAGELGGAQNAEIARAIAGDDVGGPFGDGIPGAPGDPPFHESDDSGTNETDTNGE